MNFDDQPIGGKKPMNFDEQPLDGGDPEDKPLPKGTYDLSNLDDLDPFGTGGGAMNFENKPKR